MTDPIRTALAELVRLHAEGFVCLSDDHPAYEEARAALAEPPRERVPDGWTDADADAARLALELECLLTDKDVPMPALSRWWDSAHEALELHRVRMRGIGTKGTP